MKLFEIRFAALFLAANAAGRPVEVIAGSTRIGEYARAALAAAAAFAAVYLTLVAIRLVQTKSPQPGGEPAGMDGTITAVLLTVPVVLGVWLGLRVYRSWDLWQGNAILDP